MLHQRIPLIALALCAILSPQLKGSAEGYELRERITFQTKDHGVTPFGDRLPLLHRVTDPKTHQHLLRMEAVPGFPESGVSIPMSVKGANLMVKASTVFLGQGDVIVTLRSEDGMVTSRPLRLTPHRRWDTFYYRTGEYGENLTMELRLQNPREGDYLEVDRIGVGVKAQRDLADLAVTPRYFEAGDFLNRPPPRPDGETRTALVNQPTLLTGMPIAQTSRPLTLYVEYKAPVAGAHIAFISTDGSSQQLIGEEELPASTEWRWAPIPKVRAQLTGKSITLRCTPPAGSGVELRRIVVSSDAQLAPEALASASPVLPAAPLISAVKMPDRAENWLDPAHWEEAAPYSDFRTKGKSEKPGGATQVRFAYDSKNLYVRFDCEEPILRDVEQRTHEFRQSATAQDEPVDQDDFCFIALQLREGESYHFHINAKGAVQDAKHSNSESDLRWNAGAQAFGEQKDGHYSVTTCIPLASLGLPEGKPPERMKLFLARKSAAREELSVWSPEATSLDKISGWGTLVFTPSGPRQSSSVKLPDEIVVGENHLTWEAKNATSTPSGLFYVRLSDHPPHQIAALPIPLPGEPAKLTFEVSKNLGNTVVRPSLTLLADDLSPLYRSPVYGFAVKMPSVILNLSNAGRYKIRLNGKIEKEGNADSLRVTLPLKKGANEVEIELSKGSATVRLEGEGFNADSIQWLTRPPGSESSTEWTAASHNNGVLGESGRAACFRTTLLWEETRVWPRPEPALYFAEGAAQQVQFFFEGAQGRTNWKLNVAVPKGFEWCGASSVGAWRSAAHPRFSAKEIGKQVIEGATYTVMQLTPDRKLPKKEDTPRLQQALSLWVILRPLENAKRITTIHYWSEDEGGSVTEARRSLKAVVLPRLKGAQPKLTQWQLWGPLEQIDNDEPRAALLQTAQQAGINEYEVGHAGITAGRFGKKGISVPTVMRMHFLNGSLFFGPYLARHPEQRLVTYEGKQDHSRVCTSALLNEAWGEAQRLISMQISTFSPKVVLYDYEFSPLYRGKMHTCYGPRCLMAFREHAGLPLDLELNAPVINEKYADKWVDFMARQTARIFAKMKATIKEVDPKLSFEVYSGYQTNDNAARYGVNWEYVGEAHATDRAGAGYGRPLEAFSATKKALPGATLLFGEIIEPYRPQDDIPSRQTTPARLLRRIVDSQGGVLLYELSGMDARSWRALSETTRLVVQYEPHFVHGAQTLIPGVEEDAGCKISYEGITLYCLMNDSMVERTFRIPAGEIEGGKEFYTQEMANQEGLIVLPPGDSRVIVKKHR